MLGLPSLSHRKPKLFAGPLSGRLYNNDQFVKLSSTQPLPSKNPNPNTLLTYYQNTSMVLKDNYNLDQNKNTQRRNKSIYQQSRNSRTFYETTNKNDHIPSYQQPTRSHHYKTSRTASLPRETQGSQPYSATTLPLKQATEGLGSVGDKMYSLRGSRQNMATSQKELPVPQTKVLPYVTVFLTDLITTYEEIREKILVMDLQKYFRLFFKKGLRGEFTREFYECVEPYITALVDQGLLYRKTGQEYSLPPNILQISSKQELMQTIKYLEEKGQTSTIHQIVRCFCVPSLEYREQVIKDIGLALHNQLELRLGIMDRRSQYSIMDLQRNEVTDLAQVSFFTTSLIFCRSETREQSYNRFYQINEKKLQSTKKVDFLASLSQFFRQNNRFSEHPLPPGYVSKIVPSYSPTKVIIKNPRALNQLRRKKTMKVSEQPKPFSSAIQPKNHDKEQLFMKLKHVEKLNYQAYSKFFEEFTELNKNNNSYENGFNTKIYGNRLVLLMRNFLQNSTFIKEKKKHIKEKIMKCLGIDTQAEKLTVEQYMNYRLVIECVAQKDMILKFLRSYLFEKEKSLTKQDLKDILQDSLIEYDASTASKVIVDILWIWLKKNKFIDTEKQELHDSVFMRNFFSNEMIYYFLISTIFDTNEVSAVEVAYETLV